MWYTHITHILNVQWMSYSFVWLYLFKCDVYVLNYIRINPKRFLIILYAFGSDFYHSLCSCLVLTSFFNKHVLCWKTGVWVFYDSSRDSLAIHENFCDSFRDSPVTQCKLRVHLEAFVTHLKTNSWLTKIFATRFATRSVAKRLETAF